MKSRLHYAAGLVSLTLLASAPADVIYSGYLGTSIPTNFTGVSVSVDGGTINPFFGGVGVANDANFQPVRTGTGGLDPIVNLAAGSTVDGSSVYSTGAGGSFTHEGTGSGQFTAGTEGYLGMQLSGSNYGWMRVVFTNNTSGAVIKDWAYDNSGAAIIVGNITQSAPSAGAQTVTLSSGSGQSFTLGTQITDSLGNAGGVTNSVVKNDTGTAVLTGTNSYGGATTINAGKLVVTGSISNSAVTVSGTGAVLAAGATTTIGSSVVVHNGAILAAGNAGVAATATVTGATTFNDGSIFSWDINAAGTSYGKLVTSSLVDGGSAGGAVLRIVAADSSFANTFWNTNRTWTDIFTTNGSTAIANWANIFTSVSLVNSSFTSITPAGGFFTASGNTLTWTAVPEPGGALAGLLLGAGLLRRRRR